MLHRDTTRGLYSDAPLMHSPRVKGSHIFMGHAITPSSVCKGMDEASQAGLSPDLDYEDVFGGPPKFAALMSVPLLDRTPMATLEKTSARQLSLRTGSLPVFDLPVFGDKAFSSTVYEEAGAKSIAYDDVFDEEGSIPESLSGFNLNEIPRSKASSLSSSRRMSPVHPTFTLASQLGGDATLVATNSAPNLKTRHSSRPTAAKFSRRGSLSSASSFDESSGKPGDGAFTSLRNDAFLSSLPSSPPQSGSFSPLKSTIGTTGSTGVGASTTSDDVFGGFPKRIYPQPFSAVPQDSRTVANTPETHGTNALEKARSTSINIESRFCNSSSAAHATEISHTKKCAFSRSPLVNSGAKGRDQHQKMDVPTDSSALETSQTLSNKDDDMHVSFQATFKLPTLRNPTVPIAELKFKSWKDLASDLPASHSPTPSLIMDLVPNAMLSAIVTPTKEVSESFVQQQFDESLSPQPNTEIFSHTSAAGHKGKAKSAEYTFDLEESELQALFANAWKINTLMERENYNAKFPEDMPNFSEVKDQETYQEEQRKHSAGHPKSSRIQQYDGVDLDNREDDINWKKWRKYDRRQQKERLKDVGLDHSSSYKDADFKKQFSAPVRTRSLAETSVSFGATESGNTEELSQAVTEEPLTDRVSVSCEVSSNSMASVDSLKKVSKGVAGDCTSSEYLINKQALGRSDNVERVASFYDLMSGPSQDFVYNEEQTRLSLCVPVEDAECFIDVASCLDGFQEVEGETCEHRESRWEQHMQARELGGKSLEEMQHRHAELQRQQEEKHHSSAILDGKVKRWAAGKERNLRALLSNLQHVLWSECGWQPIPLADLIEVPDVKKAYRKATLFVHPDKVQQKGASIEQKYIAERVYDILQDAWETFNMQESF